MKVHEIDKNKKWKNKERKRKQNEKSVPKKPYLGRLQLTTVWRGEGGLRLFVESPLSGTAGAK